MHNRPTPPPSSYVHPPRRWLAQGVHALALLVLLVTFAVLSPWTTGADEGWVINSFDAQVQIRADGSLDITETILVDFGSLRKHGIFRDIPVVYDYDAQQNRLYDLSVKSVTDVQGRRHKYEVSRMDGMLRIKIGDPDVYVSGGQSYRITYRVEHALNAFAEHDELYWNVNGEWPVRTERTKATVVLPADGLLQITCYQGAHGSREACRSSRTSSRAEFETTRRLPEGQQLTIVVAMPKGMVTEPQPKLERKP